MSDEPKNVVSLRGETMTRTIRAMPFEQLEQAAGIAMTTAWANMNHIIGTKLPSSRHYPNRVFADLLTALVYVAREYGLSNEDMAGEFWGHTSDHLYLIETDRDRATIAKLEAETQAEYEAAIAEMKAKGLL